MNENSIITKIKAIKFTVFRGERNSMHTIKQKKAN
jgi:hypothetical protein